MHHQLLVYFVKNAFYRTKFY